MRKFSILIPLSETLDPIRENNFKYILNQYKKSLPYADIVIGKDNSKNKFFCKARAVNNAASKAENDIFVIVDIDIIVDINSIIDSIELLNKYSFVIPFDKVYALSPEITRTIIKNNLNFQEVHNLNTSNKLYAKPPIWGGIQIVSKKYFNNVNGYDERFVGWGGEDTSFLKAIQCFHGEGLFYKGTAYHLWHSHNPSREDYEISSKNSNKLLRNQYWNNVDNKSAMEQLITSPKIDFFAGEKHYFDHLYNIWERIPEKFKGDFYISNNVEKEIQEHVNKFNINYKFIQDNCVKTNRYLCVAGLNSFDLDADNIILVNHGAGQSYRSENGRISRSYAGGEGRQNVRMFIQPNYYAAELDAKNNPSAKQAVVGCTKLDKWHQKTLSNKIKKKSKIPVIAISFHFDCHVCPETRSAFGYYESQLPMLANKNMAKEWEIIGHSHPRALDILKPYYQEHGIEVVENFEEVMERADLYIMDHMSTLYEFASTGRPVVVLNAPWYRREVEHGLRYWECADIGINVEHPAELESAIKYALEDPLEQKMKRERALTKVYAYRDGMATQRAADAIVEFLQNNFATIKIKTAHQKAIEKKKQEKKGKFKMW
jgi:hypothetical protein